MTPSPDSSPPTVSPGAPFDLDRPYALHPQVEVRPEPFGALLYSFQTRRLSFLKDPALVSVVRSLAAHPTAGASCLAAGITAPARLAQFCAALATLLANGTIMERQG